MSSNTKASHGSVTWTDLTIPDAVALRDFYSEVVGWTIEPVNMGEYEDFCMTDVNGQPVAGICHARGSNSGLPQQWLIYITVDHIEERIARSIAQGGSIVTELRSLGATGRFCVIKDPVGAVFALFEAGSS